MNTEKKKRKVELKILAFKTNSHASQIKMSGHRAMVLIALLSTGATGLLDA